MVRAQVEKEAKFVGSGAMRSRMDIMAAVLTEAVERTNKTKIMYSCNLSYRQLQRYLKLLTAMGLLRAFSGMGERETRLFETTRKGQKFLAAYRDLRALMSSSSSMH